MIQSASAVTAGDKFTGVDGAYKKAGINLQ